MPYNARLRTAPSFGSFLRALLTCWTSKNENLGPDNWFDLFLGAVVGVRTFETCFRRKNLFVVPLLCSRHASLRRRVSSIFCTFFPNDNITIIPNNRALLGGKCYGCDLSHPSLLGVSVSWSFSGCGGVLLLDGGNGSGGVEKTKGHRACLWSPARGHICVGMA